jgi:hypothetical protein
VAKFIGIKITAPSKDVFGPIRKYETQLQSTSDALIEEPGGSGESSADVYHNSTFYPLILTSSIDSDGNHHALTMPDIDTTKAIISTKSFYRVFLNQEALPT